MEYQVPQFIEIEDKIFGPLTFKQFVYVAGGAGMCFLAYRFVPAPLSFLIIAPVGAFSVALAFYKVNNRPFITAVEYAVRYYIGTKLYKWRRRDKVVTPEDMAVMPKGAIYVPKLSDSRLKDLTWSLDINETIYSKEAKGLRTREGAGELEVFKGMPASPVGRPQNFERQNIYGK